MEVQSHTPRASSMVQHGRTMINIHRAIRTCNRFELKYLITLQQAEQFREVLRAYMIPDGHGKHGRYTVISLYYDSPSFHCYWEKMNGVKVRRKLRIRHYETGEVLTDETPVFLEIKQRIDRVTQKRRAILPYGEVLRLCNDRQIPDHAPEDKAVIEEAYTLLWQYNLRPVSIVRYDRQAFISVGYDLGLRVTFDTSLSFQTYPLHLHEQQTYLPMLPAHLVVMEIKVNERIPYWLTDLIAVHNLQMVQISKYCLSLEAAQNTLSARWRSPMPECSQDVLSSAFSVFHPLKREAEIERNQNGWRF